MIRLLEGVRVIDMSRLIPGAYATAKLADLGADVIKLEQLPGGDSMRLVPPLIDELGILYLQLNRNKRSIALDLNSDAGRSTFGDIVRSADVFIEAGRPGAAAKLGMGYEDLKALKADIIYCSLSGFGQHGPYAALPAHGAQMDAAAANIEIDDSGGSIADAPNVRAFNASQSGGIHAALAIAAALNQRHRTGEGAFLDVSCWGAAVSWQYGNLVCLANTDELFPGSQGMGARYGCYRTADGGWVMIGLIEQKFWRRFCDVVGRADLAQGESPDGFDYAQGNARLADELAGIVSSRSRAAWASLAVQEQLPIAPVLSHADLLTDEHMLAQEMMVESQHPQTARPVWLVGSPIKVLGQPFEVRRTAPTLGENSAELMAEFGEQAR